MSPSSTTWHSDHAEQFQAGLGWSAGRHVPCALSAEDAWCSLKGEVSPGRVWGGLTVYVLA